MMRYMQNGWQVARVPTAASVVGLIMSLAVSCGRVIPSAQSVAEHSLTSSVTDTDATIVHIAEDDSILATKDLTAVLDGVQPWQDHASLDQELAHVAESRKRDEMIAAELAAAQASSQLNMLLEQVSADAELVVGNAAATLDEGAAQDSGDAVADHAEAVVATLIDSSSTTHHHNAMQQPSGSAAESATDVALDSLLIDVVVEQQMDEAVAALIKASEPQSVSQQLAAAKALHAHVHHPVFGHEIIEALKQAAQELAGRKVFPLSSVPFFDYTSGGREFGALRDGGWRYHAAADLLEYPGRPVHAIAAGKVIEYDYFYESTSAIVIDHGEFLIRYGEIDYFWDSSLRVGSTVQTGQKIAGVGQLWSGDSMLHIEQYAGTLTGPLTGPYNNPYQRRDDLMDVTPLLLSLENSILSAHNESY